MQACIEGPGESLQAGQVNRQAAVPEAPPQRNVCGRSMINV